MTAVEKRIEGCCSASLVEGKKKPSKRERIGTATAEQSRLVREEVFLVVARWKWFLLLACY
jgi:hypothetical protein